MILQVLYRFLYVFIRKADRHTDRQTDRQTEDACTSISINGGFMKKTCATAMPNRKTDGGRTWNFAVFSLSGPFSGFL